MAQEVMSSALLMIATVIATVALINAVYPSIYGMTGSITSVTQTVNDRMKSDIKFVYESSSDDNNLVVWVKNTGKTQIAMSNLNRTDVFFGKNGKVMNRAGYNTIGFPKWTGSIENDNNNGIWDPTETMKITITTDDHYFSPGDYRVRIVLYNGVYCEEYFTL